MLSRILCATLVLLLLPVTGMAQQDGKNLLVNGDFTRGETGWRLSVDQAGQKNGSTLKVQQGALNLTHGKGKHLVRAYQDVKVSPGDVLKLSGEVKVERALHAVPLMALMALDGQGKKATETAKSSLFNPKKSEWQTITSSIKVPEGCRKVRVNLWCFQSETQVLYRSVRLTRAVSGKKLEARRAAAQAIPVSEHPPTIDGQLDPDEWRGALKLSNFSLHGKPQQQAKHQTEIYLQIHGRDLYVAYKMDEPSPDRIQAKHQTTSDTLYADDSAQTFVSLNGFNTVQIIVNPNGVYRIKSHGNGFGTTRYRSNWYHVQRQVASNLQAIEVKSHVGDDGWVCEFKVNVDALKADRIEGEPVSDLLMNFARHRPDSDEPYSSWSKSPGRYLLDTNIFQPLSLPASLADASQAGDAPIAYQLTRQYEFDSPLVSGQPVQFEGSAGHLALPGSLAFETKNVSLGAPSRDIVTRSICTPTSSQTVTVTCQVLKSSETSALEPDTLALLQKTPEAFKLVIDGEGIHLISLHRDGILRGLATVSLMALDAKNKSDAALPYATVLDYPGLEIRAFALTRVTKDGPESMKQVLDILFLLRYNMCQWMLSAYGGPTDFPFEKHPTLGNGQYTKAQWAEFARYAKDLGIRLQPVFKSWSRVGYILHNPKYRHLAEDPTTDRGAYFYQRPIDKNICVANPESYALLKDLWGEILETMDLEDFCIGHDEATFDVLNTNPLSVQKGMTTSDWFVDSVKMSEAYFTPRQVNLWIWGDNIDPNHHGKANGVKGKRGYRPGLDISGPALLKKLPKNTYIMDWKYDGAYDYADSYPSIKMFADNGFKVVGASKHAMSNVVGIIREVAKHENAIGSMVTTWGDSVANRNERFIDAVLDEAINAMCLHGYLAWSPDRVHLNEFPYPPGRLYRNARNVVDGAAGYARNAQPVPVRVPASAWVSGDALIQALAFPGPGSLDFLQGPIVNYRGVAMSAFDKQGVAAALCVAGKKNQVAKVQADPFKARRLTFLHTINKQNVDLTRRAKRRYAHYPPGTLCGTYVVGYADGSQVEIPVPYLSALNDWNTGEAPALADPCLFGVLNDQYQLNLPTLTWDNPRPGVAITSISLRSGDHADITMAWLALSAE